MMAIIIISMAALSTNISDFYEPVDKTSYIKHDYDNIRKEFGIALQDELGDKVQYILKDDSQIELQYFNYILETFVFIESSHGNFFDAEYIASTFTVGDKFDGIEVKLSFNNGEESVVENVKYEISEV
jgi:hypothetical protein